MQSLVRPDPGEKAAPRATSDPKFCALDRVIDDQGFRAAFLSRLNPAEMVSRFDGKVGGGAFNG
jgi:hypothetical protein